MIRLKALSQNSEIGALFKKQIVGLSFQNTRHIRNSTEFSKEEREEAVVVSNDGNVVICWHPEPQFPYKFSKPLPQESKEASALKFKYDDNMKDTFRKTHPYYEKKKLQEITFTTKHVWFPSKDRKLIEFKNKLPKDREYL